jgi:TonB family protein
MGSGVTSGKLIHKVQPEYPPEARNARIEGTVVLQATIAKDGTISELHSISGPKELIPAAVKAVEQWRYQPYLLDGQPVAVETAIQVNFRLTDSQDELPDAQNEVASYCTEHPTSVYGAPGTASSVNCSDWARQNQLFKSAQSKLIKRDFDGAIADYTKAIELKPDDSAACEHRGDAKAFKSDLDGAIADFSKAIELKPDDSAVYEHRGDAKAFKSDFDGAIADFSKALELKPDDLAVYEHRGDAKAFKHDYYGAIADFTRAIQLNPNFGAAYYARYWARRVTGDRAGAEADEASARRFGYDRF